MKSFSQNYSNSDVIWFDRFDSVQFAILVYFEAPNL